MQKIVDFSIAENLEKEWLDTNGLGGWANSTICGKNTRRYHGLLVAAVKPPTDRSMLVSKLDETIICGGQRFELGCNDYGDVIHPSGYNFIKSFTKHIYPQWIYQAGEVQLRKSIIMVHDENTTILKYELLKAPQKIELEFLPLLAGRGYHEEMHANEYVNPYGTFDAGQYAIRLYQNTPEIHMQLSGTDFHPKPAWYYHFNYLMERYRGLDYTEDLFSPGYFRIEAQEGQAFYIILSSEAHWHKNPILLFENEVERRQAMIHTERNEYTRQLVLAADQFIVKRNDTLKTIIAGYNWFTDWGRDTMIALPGLCLTTGRYEDAKKILKAFANHVSLGMLPNRFPDKDEEPEYNNVDGTLWFFLAIYEYLRHTKDRPFVLQELLPALREIIDWHYRGTRYNIRVEADGLLFSGEQGYQLTWMDARIGNWVITPRMGKPVEIQALWYNALMIFRELLELNGQRQDAELVAGQASKAKRAFNEKFWYENGGYLYDVIGENEKPDPSLRPNQLLAVSLPFSLIEGRKAKSIVAVVEEKLYTPKGLRSLSPDDKSYVPHYGGDALQRDSSYHQGTAWSWLLGPYIDAIFKSNGSSTSLTKATSVIENFLPHLSEAGIGTVSEIFDAAYPYTPRGCIAQAWGVGELLRVIKRYRIDDVMIAGKLNPGAVVTP